jgi:hypothetical protein
VPPLIRIALHFAQVVEPAENSSSKPWLYRETERTESTVNSLDNTLALGELAFSQQNLSRDFGDVFAVRMRTIVGEYVE